MKSARNIISTLYDNSPKAKAVNALILLLLFLVEDNDRANAIILMSAIEGSPNLFKNLSQIILLYIRECGGYGIYIYIYIYLVYSTSASDSLVGAGCPSW
jgi:hypothetical protein